MTVSVLGTTPLAGDVTEFEEEFMLDVRVVEGSQRASGMLLSTSNGRLDIFGHRMQLLGELLDLTRAQVANGVPGSLVPARRQPRRRPAN